MGEKTILVCDRCGAPATETVTIKVGQRNLVKDLCRAHVAELVKGARRPRPGRRRGAVAAKEAASAPKRRGGARKKPARAKRRSGARKKG